jgi:hypothetical protein
MFFTHKINLIIGGFNKKTAAELREESIKKSIQFLILFS